MAFNSEIRDVADTAVWVAAYRAEETASQKPAFHDPLARRLVGEHGLALVRAAPSTGVMRWAIVVRTVAIDRLVLRAVELGADTLINLGAGLDTRPYRLALPRDFRWIEVDVPRMIEQKERSLAGETPVCRLERVALDLSNPELRRSKLAELVAGARSVAVLTEGLLPYLDPADVRALAEELRALPGVAFWIQDYFNGDLRDAMRIWRDHMAAAPIRFEVSDWFAFFAELGWLAEQNIRTSDEARRLRRMPPFSPALVWTTVRSMVRNRGALRDRTGYTLLRRS